MKGDGILRSEESTSGGDLVSTELDLAPSGCNCGSAKTKVMQRTRTLKVHVGQCHDDEQDAKNIPELAEHIGR